MILITGAAGKTGTVISKRLMNAGESVRALVHTRQQAARLSLAGVPDVVIGDMADPQTMRAAAHNARVIYHICPNMHPDEVAIGATAIRAAQQNGVARFIYHSVLHPQVEAMPHHWHKMRVEEQLFTSGLRYTILQPAAYMQNVLTHWSQIMEQGVYPIPYAPATRLSMVDLEDVAAVAAKVLTETGHEEAIYELCGAEWLSQDEVAAAFAIFLGRPVRAEKVTAAHWEQEARTAGLSDYAIQTLLEMFAYYEDNGFRGNARVLSWLLGRPPASFAQFLDRSAAAQRPT